MKGFASDIHYEDLVELLDVNFTILWGLPYYWVFLEFLILKLVHTEPLAIHYSLNFPTLALVLIVF